MGRNSYTKYRLQLHMALTTPAVTHTGAGENFELHKTGCNCTWHSPHLLCHIQELEKALRCKYVAANALNALQQVYQLMGSEVKEKAASHQAWARILLKPELGRVVEACQLLEQVALEKVQLGGSYASAQGKVHSRTFYYGASCLVQLSRGCNGWHYRSPHFTAGYYSLNSCFCATVNSS